MKRKTSTLIHLILFLNVIIFCCSCEKTPEKPNLKGEWRCSGGSFTFPDPPHICVGFFGPDMSATLNLGESSYSLSYDIFIGNLEPPNDTIEVTCVREYETGKYSYTGNYEPHSGGLFGGSGDYWTGTITFKPNTGSTWTVGYKLDSMDELVFLHIGGCNKKGSFRMHWVRN